MSEDILKLRFKRGAGDKIVIQKYDPNYLCPNQADYSNLFPEDDDDSENSQKF